MSYIIAVCGKGGTGKTTFSALVTRWLIDKHKGESVLAIDADPNANLDQALGVTSQDNIGSIVDQMSEDPDRVPKGMTKDRYLDYQIQQSLVEAQGFDLLSMGRPEGPGCYCAVNNLLRTLIERLAKNYSYLLIDNEAGMEHLSRRTTRKIDLLFVVSDYSVVGLRSAKRIVDLTKELKIKVADARLVINKAPDKINQLKCEIDKLNIPLVGTIPQDDQVVNLSVSGKGMDQLSGNSKVCQAIDKICLRSLA